MERECGDATTPGEVAFSTVVLQGDADDDFANMADGSFRNSKSKGSSDGHGRVDHGAAA